MIVCACVHVHTPQARLHTDSVKTDRAIAKADKLKGDIVLRQFVSEI